MNKRQFKKHIKSIGVFRYLEAHTHRIHRDMMIYGIGYHKEGRHIPFKSVKLPTKLEGCRFAPLPNPYPSPFPDIKSLSE